MKLPLASSFALFLLLSVTLPTAQAQPTRLAPPSGPGDGLTSDLFSTAPASTTRMSKLHQGLYRSHSARIHRGEYSRLVDLDDQLPGAGLKKAGMHIKNSARIVKGIAQNFAVKKCKNCFKGQSGAGSAGQ
jgi:hypothetical protein